MRSLSHVLSAPEVPRTTTCNGKVCHLLQPQNYYSQSQVAGQQEASPQRNCGHCQANCIPDPIQAHALTAVQSLLIPFKSRRTTCQTR